MSSVQPDSPGSRRPARASENGAVPLDNPKHEAFCRALVKGATAEEAYVEAGYTANSGNACRLKGNERVRKRVMALQAQLAQKIIEKAPITKHYVLAQSVKLHEISMANVLDESGGFVGSAAQSAARALDQIGRHVDVQAFKDTSDTNITITVDQAIARLSVATPAVIEGDYEDVTSDDSA